MKKYFTILLVIVIMTIILASCSPAEDTFGQELVINGNFEDSYNNWEKKNGSGAIFDLVNINQEADQYNDNFGDKQLYLDTGFSSTPNWLYLNQEIPVVKGGIYKVQIDINNTKAITNESMTAAQIGAYVGFAEDSGIKRINEINSTDGWQTYVVYVTPVNNDKLNVQVGIGTSASPSSGKVKFDNLSIERVETVMGGNEVYNIGVVTSVDRSNPAGKTYVILFSILSILVCYLAYVLIRRMMALYPSLKDGENILRKGTFDFLAFIKSPLFIMTGILILAFIIRLLIVNYIYGHSNDLSTFGNWAKRLADNGPWNFYQNVDTVYPPGYLYILWALGSLANVLGISTGTLGMAIFLKIPAIVCDIIIVYTLFYLGTKHYNMYISAVIAGLYAVIPVIFTNSAAWGQMDSVYGLFVLLAFIAILDKKYISVIIFYTIAVLIKAESLILLPIIAAYLTFIYVTIPRERIKLLITCGATIVGVFLISLPFTVKLGGADVVFYTFGRFVASAVANPVFSSNAFNFYGIFGLNMESVTVMARVLSFMIYAVIAFYVCFIYFYKRNRAELLLLASFLLSAVYVFSTAMTSQSMIISFALMIAYIAISGEKRVLMVFSILALTNFVAIAQLMNQSGFIGLKEANTQLISYPDKSVFMIVGGIINLLTLIYFAVITYDVCYSDDVREIEPMYNGYFKTMVDYFKGVKNIFVSGKGKK